jgi:putative ABC transport system permease protein
MLQRVPLAWLNLTHDKWRFLTSLAGVTFAVVLMCMELGFWNALLDSVAELIGRFGGELVIVNKTRYSLLVPETFPRDRIYQALGAEGVGHAWPLYIENNFSLYKNLQSKKPDESPTHAIRVLGFNPHAGVLNIPEAAAHARELMLPDTVLLDVQSRPYFGRYKPDLRPELAGRSIHVVGAFSLGTDFLASGTLATSEDNFARLLPMRDLGQVDVGIVKLRPGADRAAVLAALRARLPDDVVVMTREAFTRQEQRFWQSSTPIGFIFLVGLVMGFVVGVVICYQILSADVTAHLREFATLKTIGYHDRYLTWVVIQEALWLSLVSFVPGVALSLLLYGVLEEWTGLPMRLTVGRGAFVLALTIGMCLLSGLFAIRKVKSADPAEGFG